MAYTNHFVASDNVINNLALLAASTPDPVLKGQLAGFAAVSANTVYEMAIKAVFIDFAISKHKVLASFTASHFSRINGKISIKVIKEDYVPRFGDKYVVRFKRAITLLEKTELRASGISVHSSYANLITWRNEFAHGGHAPANATFADVAQAYQTGKKVIDTLANCMKR